MPRRRSPCSSATSAASNIRPQRSSASIHCAVAPPSAIALDRAFEVARLLVGVARGDEFAGDAEALRGARRLVAAQEEGRGAGRILGRDELRRFDEAPGVLEVFGGARGLTALLREIREQDVRGLLLALASQRLGGRGEVAREVGLDGRRAALEEHLLGLRVGEVDRERHRLEAVDGHRVQHDAIAAAHGEHVLPGRQRQPQRPAVEVGEAAGQLAHGDAGVAHRVAVPDDHDLDRAGARREVELDAARLAAQDLDLDRLEGLAEALARLRVLEHALGAQRIVARQQALKAGLARDDVVRVAARRAAREHRVRAFARLARGLAAATRCGGSRGS